MFHLDTGAAVEEVPSNDDFYLLPLWMVRERMAHRPLPLRLVQTPARPQPHAPHAPRCRPRLPPH